MKPRNFPARKLARQQKAAGKRMDPIMDVVNEALAQARLTRTKKDRAERKPVEPKKLKRGQRRGPTS